MFSKVVTTSSSCLELSCCSYITIISSWFKDVVMSIQAALVGKLHVA